MKRGKKKGRKRREERKGRGRGRRKEEICYKYQKYKNDRLIIDGHNTKTCSRTNILFSTHSSPSLSLSFTSLPSLHLNPRDPVSSIWTGFQKSVDTLGTDVYLNISKPKNYSRTRRVLHFPYLYSSTLLIHLSLSLSLFWVWEMERTKIRFNIVLTSLWVKQYQLKMEK